MGKTVVLLNSGGLDSFLAGKWLQANGYTIHSLYLHWLNNKTTYNSRSLASSEKSAALCGAASHHVAALQGENKALVKVRQEEDILFAEVYYALASSYAAKIGSENVALGIAFNDGVKPDEKNFYRTALEIFDTNKNGIKDLSRTAGILDKSFMKGEYRAKLLLPVYEVRNQVEFMRSLGLSLEDIKHTYSCSTDPPCRKCYKCFRRKIMGLSY